MAGELRKLILEAEDIQSEIVVVPEWGDAKVLIKGMNGKERAEFLRRSTNESGDVAYDRFYPELLIATAWDPDDDKKLFDPADRDQINQKASSALERLAAVAQRLSGLGQIDAEAAKGNSDSSQSNGST